MSDSPRPTGQTDYDPVFLHARRETFIIVIVWLICLIWTVGYCTSNGYHLSADEVTIVMGMPSWVFWGVLAPWVLVGVFTIVFAMFIMVDDDLGDPVDAEGDDAPGDGDHPAEAGGAGDA